MEKKPTPAQEKFVEKFFGKKVSEFSTEKSINLTNRFGGDSVMVTPLVAIIVTFVFEVERAMQSGDNALKSIHPELKRSNAVQNFDRARMLVLTLDSRAYSVLLD